MRKVVLYEQLSLDGVAEDPDKFFHHWDEAMKANVLRRVRAPAGARPGRARAPGPPRSS
jgi:hypothetical protein